MSSGGTAAVAARASRARIGRRVLRLAGGALIAGGILCLAWALVVWLWQDPFTAAYTRWQQHSLAGRYSHVMADWREPRGAAASHGNLRLELARDAAAYRRRMHAGDPIGRIVIGRIGLRMVLVDGTDHDSLTKGPGRDLRTYMPGQNRLVYIAGHRTTYLAPFSHLNDVGVGDVIRIEVPYGTFVYRAVGHEIVPADDMAVLRSPDHELLRLQACHPRFFATHRYIVDARLVSVLLPDGRRYVPPSTRVASTRG